MTATLTKEARAVADKYLTLPLPGAGVAVPYYNNKRARARLGLPALVGKGTPEEIVDEAVLYSLRKKIDLANLSAEVKKKFLVDHYLGIDCSGLAYHILAAESMARGLGPLAKHFRGKQNSSWPSKVLAVLRHRQAMNADVAAFVDNRNSHEVTPANIAPGDMIILLERGADERNHIFVVVEVTGENGSRCAKLIHSIANPKDGPYNHGVREEAHNLDAQFLENIRTHYNASTILLKRLNWF